MNPLVSVIITTYNQFQFLMNALHSVKEQTYKNIEIIVVNDFSTDKEYYDYNWDGIVILHLKENSAKKFGFRYNKYLIEQALKISKGEYIAFLDDSDIWFPYKIQMQVNALKEFGMCCTEALCGKGSFYSEIIPKKMIQEYNYKKIKKQLSKNGINIDLGFPTKWDYNLHQLVITSSVLIKKSLLIKNLNEDIYVWKNILKKNNCLFIELPCLYHNLSIDNPKK